MQEIFIEEPDQRLSIPGSWASDNASRLVHEEKRMADLMVSFDANAELISIRVDSKKKTGSSLARVSFKTICISLESLATVGVAALSAAAIASEASLSSARARIMRTRVLARTAVERAEPGRCKTDATVEEGSTGAG